MQAKNNQVLKTLRLKRVEWTVGRNSKRIVSIRVTLSDKSKHEAGKYEVNESFDFPDDRPVRAVEVGQ